MTILLRLLDFLKSLWPPGPKATAEELSAWRKVVGLTSGVALLGVLACFGAFTFMGIPGNASAADIDVKIAQAMAPVTARLTSIEGKQMTQGTYIERLVKSDISKDIHAEKGAWCRADEAYERQRLRENLDELQEEYEEVAGLGKRVTEPDCDSI